MPKRQGTTPFDELALSRARQSTPALDRLALRLAGVKTRGDRPNKSWVPTTHGPHLTRRQIVIGAIGAVALAGLASGPPNAQAAGYCTDDKFDECASEAEADYQKRIKEEPCSRSAQETEEEPWAQGGCLEARALQFAVDMDKCAQDAAKRNCGGCESCDYQTLMCRPTCVENEVCDQGTCQCGACFRANVIVMPFPPFLPVGHSCDPVQCDGGSQCDPNTGKCEPSCGDQTCAAGSYCCNGQCVDSSNLCGEPVYCGCTDTCYDSAEDCTAECAATLSCFSEICGPAPAGKCA
jgi:hypothetical protein